MQLTTPHFGTIEIDEQSLIEFPDGLPGFEECKRFKLLHEEVQQPRVLWLQCVDDAEVMFSVVDAQTLGLHYQLLLSDEECAKLACDANQPLTLLLVLSREQDAKVQANTRSPIVLNPVSRRALQKSGVRTEIVFTNE